MEIKFSCGCIAVYDSHFEEWVIRTMCSDHGEIDEEARHEADG